MNLNFKPILILLASLFVVTLIVPAVVVIPFTDKASGKLAEEEQTKPAETQIASGPTVDVAVYRSNIGDIENVPIEEYVVGVLASEMPADFEMEALKAQSLAARTYIVRQMLSGQNVSTPEGANVTDTVTHQVYKNKQELKEVWGKDYDWKIEKISKAVAETQGQILTYDGTPIDASFFSTSNGFTENSEDYWPNEIAYLKSVPSPWDTKSEKFSDQKVISVADFEKDLGISLGDSSDIGKVKSRTESNRVATVEFGNKEFSGREIREILGLRSTDFNWERKGNQIVISTKGYGHGVGMSQYGANGMAEEGKSYKDIVTHYYQGIEIASADDFMNQLTVKK